MKTEKQIRRAAKLLGDLARKLDKREDAEEYEIVSTVATALEWVIEGDRRLAVVTENLIRQAEISLQRPGTN